MRQWNDAFAYEQRKGNTMGKIIIIFLLIVVQLSAAPIRQHPDNARYFEYKGEAAVLVTSAEHYGAVINLNFDYELYLKTLHELGLNHTRIFLGDYAEEPNAFCIETNPLAPDSGRLITPLGAQFRTGIPIGRQPV